MTFKYRFYTCPRLYSAIPSWLWLGEIYGSQLIFTLVQKIFGTAIMTKFTLCCQQWCNHYNTNRLASFHVDHVGLCEDVAIQMLQSIKVATALAVVSQSYT